MGKEVADKLSSVAQQWAYQGWHLSGQGFADKGPYLYTVIMRLKDRGKISVMSDGKVWKAPSQQ